MNRFIPFLILFLALGLAAPLEAISQTTDSEAKVVMVEYSDYQCPACGFFHSIVDSLANTYGDDLKVIYKHFPLNQHQYAALAARAAEAARNQGKFKAMHDKLFVNQDRWSRSPNPQSIIIGYARDLNLDIQKFKNDLNSAEAQRRVMEEKKEAQQRGVNSTPTFIINGEKLVQLPRTYEQFKALLDIYMKEGGSK